VLVAWGWTNQDVSDLLLKVTLACRESEEYVEDTISLKLMRRVTAMEKYKKPVPGKV
jgi:hypothetical protein